MANVKDLLVNGSARVIGTIYGNATSADKVNHSLTFGSKSFNGSSAQTITLADLGGKPTQSAVSSPSASGTEISFIDTISQNTNGVITATKKTVRDASNSQSGIVSTGAQTFAGNKTFNGDTTHKGNVLAGADATYNIGSSTSKFANMYATTFHGALDGNASTATKATQDGDGNIITSKYVSIYNSNNINQSSTFSVNDLALQGSAVGMIYNSTDNPLGASKWIHVWSQSWNKGVNSSWVSQIAAGVGNSDGLYYRTTQGNIVGAAWKRLLDSSNYTNYNIWNKIKSNNRFYPLVGNAYGSAWYKVTWPFPNTDTSNKSIMMSMDITFGGPHRLGSSGKIQLSYYFYYNSTSNAWSVENVRGIVLGNNINSTKIQIKYNITEPNVMYIKIGPNQYRGISIENLHVHDNAQGYDFLTTKIEASAEPDSAVYSSSVPLVFYGSDDGITAKIDNSLILGGSLTVGSASIGTNGYITGTWLKTTGNSNGTGNFVTQNGGWLYYRTPAETRGDIGAPSTTGLGASGTWGINITGNAATASKVNNKLTVGSKTYDGSADVTIAASDLGLASAMLFLGTTTTTITDGATTNPVAIDGANKTVAAGNVVLYGSKEFVWTGSAWEELGNEGSYKIVQSAVADPTASGTSNTFIATISQDTNGKITATKKTVVVTNSTPTLSWGTTSTIGTVAGTNLQVTMPANPNTWRGIQNNLTSDSTTDSLSAAQGKVLKSLIDGKAASSHTHSYLPLSGGTVTGATQFNHYLKLNAWSGYGTGTANFWYDGNNKFIYIENAIDLKLAGTKVSKEGHTHNYAGSSNAGGAANSANKLTTARTISLGTGVTSTATSFDGSSNITIPVNSIKESYLTWGGKNFSGDYGCIDAAMVSDLGANRLMFGKAAGITIQYSTDGGSTWTDYGASDSAKVGLFSSGYGFNIGKATKDTITSNCMLRVIINTDSFGVYTTLNKFVIYLSTNGSSGCYCTIDASLENSPTTFTTFANKVPISGWSGYNVINTSGITTYGNSPSSQYGLIRFTFGCTGVNTNYSGLSISQIMGFGGVGWSTPSTMAKTGHLYSYDSNQNATFPATVTAPTFNGSLSGNASTATKLQTARTISLTGSVTGSGTFDGSGNLSITTTTNHTHNYAGSSSAGGSANSAVKLDTNTAGDSNTPVYFSGGKPVACTSLDLDTSGNAATASTAITMGQGNNPNTDQDANDLILNTRSKLTFYSFNTNALANMPSGGSNWGYLTVGAFDRNYNYQTFIDGYNGTTWTRILSGGTWGAWKTTLDSNNYTNYTVTKTGSGASGTWDISISGNAATATQLQTARIIWGQSFNGTANISGNMTGVGNINTAAAPAGTIYMNNWFRSTEKTGWYNETYGGGLYMSDSTYIRNYGGKTTRLDNLCLGADNNSYRLYVNGTSYFNGNTTHNGIDYFANGTTYYIDNNADANLRRGLFAGTSNADTPASNFYYTGALEIREAGRVGNTQSSFNFAPRIGFHWASRIAASLSFHSDGIFYFRKQNGNDRATIDANLNGNAATATYTTQLLGVDDSNNPWNAVEGNLIRAVWNVKGDGRWYLTAKTYNCRVNYADSASTADTVDGYHFSDLENRYVNITGDTMSGDLTAHSIVSNNWLKVNAYPNYGTGWGGFWYDGNNKKLWLNTDTGNNANFQAAKVYGAVWNDYAEYRKSDVTESGRVVIENGDGTLSLSTKRLQRGAEVISDTYGFAIGETDECKTPIAATGRVLAYTYESIEEYRSKTGWPVCSGPNGTVSIMTEEEEEKYPSRIIGTISEVPDYEEWGTGKVKTNGRVWIRIK